MSKIISIHSFRGGTGKSNITANLAVTVARAGNRVGVIDTDIQSPGIHVLFGLKEVKVDKELQVTKVHKDDREFRVIKADKEPQDTQEVRLTNLILPSQTPTPVLENLSLITLHLLA